jgi:hypothetical protein
MSCFNFARQIALMYIKRILLALFILIQVVASAQTGNPFDLTPRLKEQPDTSVAIQTSPGNPFDIIRGPDQKESKNRSAEAPVFKKPKEIQRTSNGGAARGAFLFTLIVSMLVLAAIFMTLLREFIGKVYRAFLNDNLLNQLHREQGTLVSFPFQLLYLLAFIIMGIFLFLLLDYNNVLPFSSMWKSLFTCIGFVAGLFIVKHVFLSFMAWLYPIEKEIKVYSFTIMVFNIILGLILLPLNVIIAYAPVEIISIAIYIALGILLLVYLFRQLRSLFAASKYLAFHKLHFLLYLCAVEIAPVLVLIKMILLTGGAQ